MSKRITIDPITRLEGHGKIEIFLDDAGDVENAYFQVPELRGFEQFCIGRPVEELPRITPRLCGVCPGAHHMASAKAVDNVYHATPPPAAVKLRELFYNAHMAHSHIAHFYALGAPDFIVGPDADPGLRNILGVIQKVGVEVGKEVIKHRAYAQKIQEMIGGKATHSVCALPGGMSKPLTKEERDEIEPWTDSMVEFCKFTFQAFEDIVLKNQSYVDLITGDTYALKTYYISVVDENDAPNFYDGRIKVVDPEGNEFLRFNQEDYLEHIAEHVEPWTYLKFPFLTKIGWSGLVDGKDSGVVRAAPLARLNAAKGMATPQANAEYNKMYEVLGGKPVHHTLAMHWARIIEMMQSAEDMQRLIRDPEITSTEVRALPAETPDEGVGIIEAPRGTLIHHYKTDPKGIVTDVNLIVATVFNHAAICMDVKQSAQKLIRGGNVNDGLLNMVEMAFRAYDPCFACSTNTLPGEMPLIVRMYDSRRELVQEWRRD
ncbi:MAG: Ni/Fe hydrogenase subunit alpha [Candidatus Eisenbacteria bacterium]|nr:Ni/Fe hydrogenase subunit alpha [Candidatus Eisenbacteria bacterium]